MLVQPEHLGVTFMTLNEGREKLKEFHFNTWIEFNTVWDLVFFWYVLNSTPRFMIISYKLILLPFQQ